jgi:outer membrane murein-binding lipoprotein Lpp
MNEDKTYSAKVVLVSFALGVLLCLFGCVCFYSSRTESTESRNVNRTIQQLTTDGDRATEAVNSAETGLTEAQDTANRISERVDESTSVLDRLQAELDRIAEANGLTE